MDKDTKSLGLFGGDEYGVLREGLWYLWYYDDLEKTIANTVSEETREDRKYNVLEIGVETGITTAFVLDALKKHQNVNIFAIGDEEIMLDKVKKRFVGINNIQFIKTGLLEYLKSLENGFLDGCYTGFIIHNLDLETRKELFKELGRVIKKGGFFVNGDKIAVDDAETHKDHYDREMRLYNKIDDSEIRAEWIKHYEEDELAKFTEKEQKGLLETNGFSDVNFVFRELMSAVVVAKRL